MEFGLTRQEANIYMALDENEGITGYEIAKIINASRSNVYTALTGLVEKGGAYVEEENVNKYVRVKINEFCENHIRSLNQIKNKLIEEFSIKVKPSSGYITIRGTQNILNKIINMLNNVEERVYIYMEYKYMHEIRRYIDQLIISGKKVVILTDKEMDILDSLVYVAELEKNQVGIIVDSQEVLTGEILESNSTCLYSNNTNLVFLFKKYLRNEIKLIKVEEEGKGK